MINTITTFSTYGKKRKMNKNTYLKIKTYKKIWFLKIKHNNKN